MNDAQDPANHEPRKVERPSSSVSPVSPIAPRKRKRFPKNSHDKASKSELNVILWTVGGFLGIMCVIMLMMGIIFAVFIDHMGDRNKQAGKIGMAPAITNPSADRGDRTDAELVFSGIVYSEIPEAEVWSEPDLVQYGNDICSVLDKDPQRKSVIEFFVEKSDGTRESAILNSKIGGVAIGVLCPEYIEIIMDSEPAPQEQEIPIEQYV